MYEANAFSYLFIMLLEWRKHRKKKQPHDSQIDDPSQNQQTGRSQHTPRVHPLRATFNTIMNAFVK